MRIIDGSLGEGGGQVLRTSLALSVVTGKPFRIENIRAKRKTPGLLRQHLTAVQAAAAISDAALDDARIGSTSLTFVPRTLKAGDYSFTIGTAGSTMLVLQTILLPLVLAGEPSTVSIEGGTHNPSAPPFDFVAEAFLPLLRRIGAEIELELLQPGFYPAGGGKIRAVITPAKRLTRLDLEQRGEVVKQGGRAVVANLAYSIAQREAKVAAEAMHWSWDAIEPRTMSGSIGPGNAIWITIASEHVTDVFTAFGERGVRAEDVALKVAKQARRYINSEAAVGEHLADQLLLPLALGEGGVFTTTPLSAHSTTNIETIRQFSDARITVDTLSRGMTRVQVDPAR